MVINKYIAVERKRLARGHFLREKISRRSRLPFEKSVHERIIRRIRNTLMQITWIFIAVELPKRTEST